MNKSFYIAKKEDGTYGINTDGKGVFFVAEKNYPVTIYYSRFDLNGCRILEGNDCKNAEELKSSLKWHLKCNHMIEKVWDFDLNKCKNKAVEAIFDELYDKAVEAIHRAMEEILAG